MAGEYIINYTSDALKDAFIILPRAVNTDTSLTLFGKGAPNYGEGLQEDLVHLLESFCSDSPPERPTVGQLWYSNNTQTLNICTSVSPEMWKILGIYSNTVAPTAPEVGSLWFDITNSILKYWDGSNWIAMGGSDLASSIPPSSPTDGTLWVDTNVGVVKYWTGIGWQTVGTNNVQTAYIVALMLKVSPTIADYLSTITSNVQNQIDALVATVGVASNKVDKSGDTMTGYLTLNADPVNSLHAATKQYVASAIFAAMQSISGTNNASAQQNIIETYATSDDQTVFTLSDAPSAACLVYISGAQQAPTTYSIVGTTLTLSAGVQSGTEILIDYYTLGGSPGIAALNVEEQVIVGTPTIVNISTPYTIGDNSLFVFVNGVKQHITETYTETTTGSITFLSPLIAGDEIVTVSYDFNTTAAIQRVFTTGVEGQTIFTVSPAYHHTSNPSDPLNVGVMVFVNGVAQGLNEYVQTNGESIVLSEGVTAGTQVEIYAFNIN